jgi:hypothetical protein
LLHRLGAVSAVVAALLVPAGAATAAATVAAGGIGVRLLSPPGAAAGSPLARSYIVGVVAPGSSIRRTVEVENSTRQPARVAVYAGPASIRRGRFVFASSRRLNRLARWTRISSHVLHLPPGAKAFVALTVKVPADASYGERYAVVWAELAATVNNQVRLVNRVGIRLYVTVGRGGAAPATFAIGRLRSGRSSAGDPFVAASVVNSGARTLLIGGDLTLSNGPGGTTAGPFPAALDVALSPGGSAEVRMPLDRRLPRGPWLARLRLRSGQLERRAVATVLFPRGRTVPVVPAGAPSDPRRHLLTLLAFLMLGVLGLAALVRWLGGGRSLRVGRGAAH